MNLVYILGNGSKWNNNELKYSLRSISDFGVNVDNVYIVGSKPEWVNNIHHIQVDDPYRKKCDNTWNKLCVISTILKDPFVLMNDDFYFLQSFDFNSILLYYDGFIDEVIKKHTNKSYIQTLNNTIKFLELLDKPIINYAVHGPITIDPAIVFNWTIYIKKEPGISFRNFYGNVYNDLKQRTPLTDLKFNESVDDDTFKVRVEGRKFFSISDKYLDEVGKKRFSILYPNHCKFEK